MNLFTGNGIQPGSALLAESLVLLGLCSLFLVVEPLGALIVVSVLGTAAWGFHRLTRGRIARWGKARQHHEGLRLQHLQQGLGGAKDVKLLGREIDFLDQYRAHNAQSARVGPYWSLSFGQRAGELPWHVPANITVLHRASFSLASSPPSQEGTVRHTQLTQQANRSMRRSE